MQSLHESTVAICASSALSVTGCASFLFADFPAEHVFVVVLLDSFLPESDGRHIHRSVVVAVNPDVYPIVLDVLQLVDVTEQVEFVSPVVGIFTFICFSLTSILSSFGGASPFFS